MASKGTVEIRHISELVVEDLDAVAGRATNGNGLSAQHEEHIGGLPAQPTAILGRSGELDALSQTILQGATRLLTLTGPGGVGKTRLAIALADETRHAFSDGAVFVDLAESKEQ